MDAIAVVLALEDYQNLIAKNLRVRDMAVDIYGVAMIPPPLQGRDFFSPGRGGNLFVHQTGGRVSIYTSQNLSIWRLCLRINDSGLFAWISLTSAQQYCII